jgi:AcrR family transcriptional regulator
MLTESSIDRRIVRTKVAIREALVSLVEEKGFEALSVSDLTRRADINRGTFYLHYQDKFDLLEQTETEIIRDFEAIILQANDLNFADFNFGTAGWHCLPKPAQANGGSQPKTGHPGRDVGRSLPGEK